VSGKAKARPSRVRAARDRVDNVRSSVIASRERFGAVDVAFDVSARNMTTGGAVLAGAIAFRLFLWTLPASLLAVGLLGFDPHEAATGANHLGLGRAAATVGTAAQQAHRARWTLVVIGLFLLVSVSHTLGVTVRSATALTWQLPLRRERGYARTTAATALCALLALAFLALCTWLRTQSEGAALIVSLLSVVVWGGGWWAVSMSLPHQPTSRWDLLPGAIVFGVGADVLHIGMIFFLARKISSASALYGSLGLASTLLLTAYLVARLMLAAAAVNAIMNLRRQRPPEAPPPVAAPDDLTNEPETGRAGLA
jgi:uncharacterized BrkB/YihY/UPF0761 family membrane protein